MAIYPFSIPGHSYQSSKNIYRLCIIFLFQFSLNAAYAQEALHISKQGNVVVAGDTAVTQLQLNKGEFGIGRFDGKGGPEQVYGRIGLNNNLLQYLANNAQWDGINNNWIHVDRNAYVGRASVIMQTHGEVTISTFQGNIDPITWHQHFKIADNGEISVGDPDHTGSSLKVYGRVKDQSGYLVPPGGIIMYCGNSADLFESSGIGKAGTYVEGWALCNGLAGRPDMTDRFVLGAEKNAAKAGFGDEGGHHKIKITWEQMPKHTHGYVKAGLWGGGNVNSYSYDNRGNNSINAQTDPAGFGDEVDIRPKYYRVFYIIKL